MSTRRNQVACVVVAITVAGSAALTMSGCEGLDYSARAEGTGVQIVGAIVVLAKYHASNHQKAVAEQSARSTFIRAAKPHYERRRNAALAEARKKIAEVEGGYGKRITQAQRGAPAPGVSSVAELEAEKKRALEKAQADAAAELASLDREWHSLGGIPSRGLKMEAAPSDGGGVPLASTRDREALVASAAAHLPKYIAVAVPPQGIAAEQGGQSIVMLWDTRRQRLAGDDVLVLNRTLRDGADVKVEGVTARFAAAK